MRLTIYAEPELSAQLKTDLHKIYQQQPLVAENLCRQQASGRLFAACFNERYIAAASVVERGEENWLEHLCVRDLTRRRGVGKHLLQQLLEHTPARPLKVDLQHYPEAEREGLRAFFRQQGFVEQAAGIWQKD